MRFIGLFFISAQLPDTKPLFTKRPPTLVQSVFSKLRMTVDVGVGVGWGGDVKVMMRVMERVRVSEIRSLIWPSRHLPRRLMEEVEGTKGGEGEGTRVLLKSRRMKRR